ATLPVPLLIVQHMPANFTPAFAQRLDQQCAITVRHAEDGDSLQPGTALLAPGGKQMTVERRGQQNVVRIQDGDPGLNYKPSADIMFSSVAKLYGGKVLSVILTGMGADGREGARLLKQGGSTVWAQNKESSVIYGMPGAVAKANLTDEILDLASIGPGLTQVFH
ncbi:MAG TPA: chemotaxis response regulator protein-glutamate methylesterase, partial [Gammaproteobacteria bacterium]|nr:chemotaxis response regulator protein-glutamate methylesterase [Gammaproteobacteria bacterium]